MICWKRFFTEIHSVLNNYHSYDFCSDKTRIQTKLHKNKMNQVSGMKTQVKIVKNQVKIRIHLFVFVNRWAVVRDTVPPVLRTALACYTYFVLREELAYNKIVADDRPLVTNQPCYCWATGCIIQSSYST